MATKCLQFAFNQDIAKLKADICKKKDLGKDFFMHSHRLSAAIHDVWCKHEQVIPVVTFQTCVLEIGDLLLQNKLPLLADWQCFGVILSKSSHVDPLTVFCVDELSERFFPEGFDDPTVHIKAFALLGTVESRFQMLSHHGYEKAAMFKETMDILKFLQIFSELLLPKPPFFASVYNASLLIYKVSRYLMTFGLSNRVVKYILWVCLCMENSFPLLKTKYLDWRTTLYATVCQCYIDCNMPTEAEEFARRGLHKVQEMHKLLLEKNGFISKEDESVFRLAVVKLGSIIFRLSIIVKKRKQKGPLYGTKILQREMLTPARHRTVTERYLADMFEGKAAQFLAILEALDHPNIHTLNSKQPAGGGDAVEWQIELLAVGLTIICEPRDPDVESFHTGITDEHALRELAAKGSDKISASSYVSFLKLLFRYEQWEIFRLLMCNCCGRHTVLGALSNRASDIVVLDILTAVASYRKLKNDLSKEDEEEGARQTDDIHPIDVELNYVEGICHGVQAALKFLVEEIDMEIVLDAMNMVWTACKPAFERFHNGSLEVTSTFPKKLLLEELNTVHKVLLWSGQASSNIEFTMEVTLTLAFFLEELAIETVTPSSWCCLSGGTNEMQYYQQSTESLKNTLDALQEDAALHCYYDNEAAACTIEKKINIVALYFRHLVKLAHIPPEHKGSTNIAIPVDSNMDCACKACNHSPSTTEKDYPYCGKNSLYRAMVCVEEALLVAKHSPQVAKEFAAEGLTLLKRTIQEESKYSSVRSNDKPNSSIPPPPEVFLRTDTSIVFKPARFLHSADVTWYQIFGRSAAGKILKVRLNDYHLPGTGVMVPSRNPYLQVSGLKPNERYIFAIAAYTAQGQLISGSIGETSRPILASCLYGNTHLIWFNLVQAAYTVQAFESAITACDCLWESLVYSALPQESDGLTTNYYLKPEVKEDCHNVLLKSFVVSIFIRFQSAMHLCLFTAQIMPDLFPPYKSQFCRLTECERFRVAIEAANFLNEHRLALNATICCYKLLYPFIYHRIPSAVASDMLKQCMPLWSKSIVSGNLEKSSTVLLLKLIVPCVIYFAKTHQVKDFSEMIGMFTLAREILSWSSKCPALASWKIHKHGNILNSILDSYRSRNQLSALEKASSMDTSHSLSSQIKAVIHFKNFGLLQTRALEVDIFKFLVPVSGELGVTGNEDINIMHLCLLQHSCTFAHKELIKFRRHPRYVEFTAHLLQKALDKELYHETLTWSDEVLKLLANKQLVLEAKRAQRQRVKSPQRGTKKQPLQKEKKKKARPEIVVKDLNDPLLTDEELDEAAAVILQRKIPKLRESYENKLYRRKALSEQNPWWSQINLTLGLACLSIVAKNLKQKWIRLSATECCTLVPGLCTLPFVGAIVQPEEKGKSLKVTMTHEVPVWHKKLANIVHTLYDKTGEFSLHLEKADTLAMPKPRHGGSLTTNATGATGTSLSSAADRLQSLPLSQQTENMPESLAAENAAKTTKPTETPRRGSMESGSRYRRPKDKRSHGLLADTEKMVAKSFKHMERAIILAHRGHHWTLLQNVLAAIWESYTNLLILSCHPKWPCSIDVVRKHLWRPLYTALDCTLEVALETDMDKEPFSSSFLGDDCSLKAGTWFDEGKMDRSLLTNFTLAAVEVLYLEEKWERLIHLCFKFLAWSGDNCASKLGMFLLHAQEQLRERIELNGGPCKQLQLLSLLRASPQEYLQTQLIMKGLLRGLVNCEVMSGANPDGLKLACVPLDTEFTMALIERASVDKPEVLNCLEKSQQLLTLYMIRLSTETDVVDLRKMETISLPSEFSTTASVLSSSFSETLASYKHALALLEEEKTVSNKTALLTQSLFELGNLYFSVGNMRHAFLNWCKALDVLLKTEDAITIWRSKLASSAAPQSEYRPLVWLDLCGLWGCLLGGVIACNIAKYIYTVTIDKRAEACLLASEMFQAVLFSSMPVIKSQQDYVLMNVRDFNLSHDLIPMVNLVGDNRRCCPSQIVAALTWLGQQMARNGHMVESYPVFVLQEHFSVGVTKNFPSFTESLCSKIHALSGSGMYSATFRTLLNLFAGFSSKSYVDTSKNRKLEAFRDSRPVTELDNYEAAKEWSTFSMAPSLILEYGPHLSFCIFLSHMQHLVNICTQSASAAIKDIANVIRNRLLTAILMLQHVENVAAVSTVEVELHVTCLQLLAKVEFELGHSSLAATVARQALSVLQAGPGDKRERVINTDYKINFRMDVQSWLQCRLTLVTALYQEILINLRDDVSECKQQCMEGVQEAEMFGCIESEATFLLFSTLCDLHRQSDERATMVQSLQKVCHLLSSSPCLSIQGCLLFMHAASTLAELDDSVDLIFLESAISAVEGKLGNLREGRLFLGRLHYAISYAIERNIAVGIIDKKDRIKFIEKALINVELATRLSRDCIDTKFAFFLRFLKSKLRRLLWEESECLVRDIHESFINCIRLAPSSPQMLPLVKHALLSFGHFYSALCDGSTTAKQFAEQDAKPVTLSMTSTTILVDDTEPSTAQDGPSFGASMPGHRSSCLSSSLTLSLRSGDASVPEIRIRRESNTISHISDSAKLKPSFNVAATILDRQKMKTRSESRAVIAKNKQHLLSIGDRTARSRTLGIRAMSESIATEKECEIGLDELKNQAKIWTKELYASYAYLCFGAAEKLEAMIQRLSELIDIKNREVLAAMKEIRDICKTDLMGHLPDFSSYLTMYTSEDSPRPQQRMFPSDILQFVIRRLDFSDDMSVKQCLPSQVNGEVLCQKIRKLHNCLLSNISAYAAIFESYPPNEQNELQKIGTFHLSTGETFVHKCTSMCEHNQDRDTITVVCSAEDSRASMSNGGEGPVWKFSCKTQILTEEKLDVLDIISS